MKLSIIIVSYNVKHYLHQCIDSLLKAVKDIDAEICVIDNHSKDGTVDSLKSYGKNIKIIASPHNNGFAKANNIAIRQTSGDYVLLLNPDTFVGENAIKDCLEFMDAHADAGGLGVQMLKSDGSKALESRRGLPTPMTSFYKMCGLCAKYPTNKCFGKYYMCDMSWDEPGRIEIISGAFFMARRSALDKIGLLDEDFFMYGEDIDLSYRLLKKGYSNWYLPVKILHYKGESTQKSSFRYVHVFYEAMLIFFRKHYGHLSFWLCIPIKMAIYIKATFALIKMLTEKANKTLGFTNKQGNKSPRYIFIGSAKSIKACREIAARNGLDAEFYESDETSNNGGHAKFIENTGNNLVYAVYDVSSYKYETILNLFSKNVKNNILIGTYHPKYNIIITDNEIIS